MVVANILAPTLIALADDLDRLLASDGTLVISGVLSAGNGHGHRHVLDALGVLQPVSTIDDDGWATVTLRRRART
ncbi:MAG: 50S ribosomal protein L11 methyltransferase [Actinomycetota bacterium]